MDQSTKEFMLSLQKKAIKAVADYVLLAEKKLGVYIPMPSVRFSDLGTTAGRAWYGKNLIEFNPRLLRNNHETFLVQTTGHEVAHLVAFAKYSGCQPHGKDWTKVMWAFSLPANRCHNYETAPNAGTKRAVAYQTENGLVKPTSVGKIITFD